MKAAGSRSARMVYVNLKGSKKAAEFVLGGDVDLNSASRRDTPLGMSDLIQSSAS